MKHKKIQQFQVRWLLTRHDVISEEQLSGLIPDELRERYQKSVTPPKPKQPIVSEPIVVESEKEIAPPPEKAEESTDEKVLVVDFSIRERSLSKALKPHIEHKTLNLIALEKLESATFAYYPMLKASMIFNNKKKVFSERKLSRCLSIYTLTIRTSKL